MKYFYRQDRFNCATPKLHFL